MEEKNGVTKVQEGLNNESEILPLSLSNKEPSRKRFNQQQQNEIVVLSEIKETGENCEFKNLLQEMAIQSEKLNHFVYALALLKEDGVTFDHIFYIGETNSLDDRFMGHKKDKKNERKFKYFEKYSRSRIRMIELYNDKMGMCKFLEKLLIQHGTELGLNLTNDSQNKDTFNVENCNIIDGLSKCLTLGMKRNEGKNANTVKLTAKADEGAKKRRTKSVVKTHLQNMNLKFSSSIEHLTKTILNDNQKMDLDIFNFQVAEDIRRNNIENLQKENSIFNQSTSIVATDSLLDHKTLPGTFKNLEENEIIEMFKNDETATAFAVRIGGILNEKTCTKCEQHRPLKLQKKSVVNNYHWRCHNGNTCSSASLVENTIFEHQGLSIRTLLQMIYYISKNIPDENIIINRFDFHNKNVAKAFITYIRLNIIDEELRKYSINKNLLPEISHQNFFQKPSLDHFGILLFWIIKHWGSNRVEAAERETSKIKENPKKKKKKQAKSGDTNLLKQNTQDHQTQLNPGPSQPRPQQEQLRICLDAPRQHRFAPLNPEPPIQANFNPPIPHNQQQQFYSNIPTFNPTPVYLLQLTSFGCGIIHATMALYVDCTKTTEALILLGFFGFFLGGAIPGSFTASLSIAPMYAGMISSFTLIAGAFGNILAPAVVGFFIEKGTRSEWGIVFGVAVLVNFTSGIVFLIFGTAKIQSWGIPAGPAKVEIPDPDFAPEIIEDGAHNIDAVETTVHKF
uniref:GIY-YIG domain-containing protein n=1 Tax=Panagrolaimus sp. ES5 TaxID=591445 RepID=A0AC34GPJ3_9BILA